MKRTCLSLTYPATYLLIVGFGVVLTTWSYLTEET